MSGAGYNRQGPLEKTRFVSFMSSAESGWTQWEGNWNVRKIADVDILELEFRYSGKDSNIGVRHAFRETQTPGCWVETRYI